jgi:hypothetical protein
MSACENTQSTNICKIYEIKGCYARQISFLERLFMAKACMGLGREIAVLTISRTRLSLSTWQPVVAWISPSFRPTGEAGRYQSEIMKNMSGTARPTREFHHAGSPIKRPSVKENTSPGEETTIVCLLRYGGVVYLLRVCRYVSQVGSVDLPLIREIHRGERREERYERPGPTAFPGPEIAIPRSAGLCSSQ